MDIDHDPPNANDQLTARECEAMEWLVLGFTTREIARRMRIEDNTAECYLKHSFDKLGATNRVQAAVLYIRHYWADRLPAFWRRWHRYRKGRKFAR